MSAPVHTNIYTKLRLGFSPLQPENPKLHQRKMGGTWFITLSKINQLQEWKYHVFWHIQTLDSVIKECKNAIMKPKLLYAALNTDFKNF